MRYCPLAKNAGVTNGRRALLMYSTNSTASTTNATMNHQFMVLKNRTRPAMVTPASRKPGTSTCAPSREESGRFFSSVGMNTTDASAMAKR